MVRVTNSVASHRRKKRIFKRAKGFWGDRKNHLRQSMDCVMRAMASNYIHRKQRKSEFRGLWISRLGVASKACGISYSKLISGLAKAGSKLNRKMLSEMAISDPAGFVVVCETAKSALVE
jgi:large subunit ribosomal protein L20